MSLYRNFFNVGAMTTLSRLLGFGRDVLLASVLGTGLAADAFVAAFRFPNLFRRLFAEGAFNAAFIPLFSGALAHSPQEAQDMAARIISWLIGFLLVVTVLAEVFMPYVLTPFVPGFLDDPEKFELAVYLTRICFPYLACMSLMAAYGSILNGLEKFAVAAFAPVLLNVVLVGVIVVLMITGPKDEIQSAIWISVGTVIGGVAQLGLVAWAVQATGYMPRFTWPRFTPEVRRFWTLALPAIATGGITQINIFIGTIIASSAAGAMSYLYYADRLYQLPLGIIGIAIGVVLLPALSSHLKAGRVFEAQKAMDQSLLMALLLTLPAAAGLIALSEPMIRLLFERGAFDAEATTQTAAALTAYAFGLPAFVLIKLFQPGYFAREDTVTPTVYAGVSVAVNIALSLALFPAFQHVGIAIATSVSAWANVLLLGFTLSRRGHFVISAYQARQNIGLVIVSTLMGLGLWFTADRFQSVLAGQMGVFNQAALLFGMVGIGAIAYFAMLHVSGIQKMGALRRGFRRVK